MYRSELENGTIQKVRKLIFDEISKILGKKKVSAIDIWKLSILDEMLRSSGSDKRW